MTLTRPTRLLVALLLSWVPPLHAQIAHETVSDPSGHWEGTIQIPNHELNMVLDLAKTPTGRWIGSMSIPLSTSIDVPLGSLSVDGTTLRFTAFLPGRASFDGNLSADARGLSGTASNDEGAAPFQLTRHGDANVKVPPPSSAMSKDFEGAWEGTLDIGGNTRRIGLRLAPGADGIALGTLIVLDQGNQEISVTTVTIEGRRLSLESRPVSGRYVGTLGTDGEIVGEWTQRSDQRSLIFRRTVPPK
jgi:hypothetical protein